MSDIVPEPLRPGIREILDDLVAGRRPDMLTWVRRYGREGATLVPQPDDVWSHPRTSVIETVDGGWHVAVPLWTTDESPSDLFAEVCVDGTGTVVLTDVQVL